MKTTLIKTRRFNKETYYIYLNQPSYEGEAGCCGMIQKPYVHVETPENCFGYSDTVLFSKIGYGYTLHRPLANWIMNELEKESKKILQKYATI